MWPVLLRIARRTELPVETRRQAVFWLGQAAGEAATRGLDSLASDRGEEVELRKQAVFALSQRPADEGVPVLIRIARSNPHAELRKSALFWLGQSEDPRAIALFEEILRFSLPITFPPCRPTPTPSSARRFCLPRVARSGRRRRS